jgi:hypothetical protein
MQNFKQLYCTMDRMQHILTYLQHTILCIILCVNMLYGVVVRESKSSASVDTIS